MRPITFDRYELEELMNLVYAAIPLVDDLSREVLEEALEKLTNAQVTLAYFGVENE